ncbi:MAG: hypothetical protein KJ749_08475, partial [Planctomycetes bacterium]|nr:hypothetical protein [Planctomycetota bacterium]
RIRVLWDMGDKPTRLSLRDPSKAATVVNIVGGETTARPSDPATAGRYELMLGADPIYFISE